MREIRLICKKIIQSADRQKDVIFCISSAGDHHGGRNECNDQVFRKIWRMMSNLMRPLFICRMPRRGGGGTRAE